MSALQIQSNAPYAVRKEITINAPVEKVWQLLTDFDRWPEWQEAVKSSKMEGVLKPGGIFRWNSGGMNLVSTLKVVEPQRSVGWTGDAMGTHAIHIWHLRPVNGGTKVTTEESLSGWLPRLLRLFMPGFLDNSLTKTLDDLRKAVENR